MFDPKKLDELAQKLSEAIPENLKETKQELEKNFRGILQSTFSKLDLVTREEFDAQKGVLLRTREKLEKLEKMVNELEEKKKL